MKKKISITGIEPLSILGPNDDNIKLLESKFPIQIVVRGTTVILDGKESDVSKLNSILQDMIITVNQKGFISTSDVKVLLNLEGSGLSEKQAVNGDKPVILFTHKGAVKPRTPGQVKYHQLVLENDIVFAIGPAGTGKTYQAVASAVASLKNREVQKIIITRPAVEAGERLGFLPGDLKEKVDPYLTPLYDALNEMLPSDKLKTYLDQRVIEVAPLAYMRGRTLHNAFMILDEAQNCTRMQMKMFLTRLGVTSKSIVTGDITQIDLPGNEMSGLVDASRVLRKVDGIAFVYFHEEDVVRHRLVKDIIKAYSIGEKE
ncbi:MAG: PhoH family protein [Fidelibacterota bacterium]